MRSVRSYVWLAIAMAAAMTLSTTLAAAANKKDAGRVAQLEEQVASLQQRIDELEQQLSQRRPARRGRPTGGSPFTNDWDPLREIEQMRQEINRLFQDSVGRSGISSLGSGTMFELSTDIRETPTEYIYVMDVPGMDKQEIKVEVKDRALYVTGKRKQDVSQADEHVSRRERVFGSFSRVISLPPDACADEVKAEYEKGVLTVRISRKSGVPRSSFQVPVL